VAVLRVGDRRGAPGREQATVTVMLNPTWPRWRAGRDDIDVTVATLDAVGVRLIGAEISGLDPAGVTFTGTGPVSPALGRYMAATMTQVERDLVDDELMASPLIRREAFRRLAVGLLVAFPNTTQSIAPARGPDHEPATVRRAVAYIDAHALDDIDISQIAAAARIGPRGLQAAFRKHRGQTPLEYLRQVRMDGAHRDLMAGDPTRGDTVAATAARWRFTHAGRFSVEYRESHGRSPSQTLRR
jgi:AraC-like DNA-binding protein